MGRTTRTDAELITACRGGDHGAFGEIVERYQRAVGAVAYSGTGNRALADDVTQDTFVTAWRQLAALRDVDRLPAWLCGIARNLARAARRKRGRETALDDHDVAGDGSPYDQLRDREDEHVVAVSLEEVPETYREALVLFYCEQQSVPAVAQALGISENATHQRLARGRQHLADRVGVVERTLERRRPRAGLAAAVIAAIAALGAIGSSQVEAATPTPQGSTMFKLGIAALLVTAIAGTGYVVARSKTEPTAPVSGVAPASPARTTTATPAVTRPTARGAAAATPVNAVARGARPTTTAGDDPLTCASVAGHLATIAALTQPDLAEALERGDDDFVTRAVKPMADGFLDDCTQLAWSLDIRTCIAHTDDFVEMQSKCPPPPTRHGGNDDGRIQIIDDEPRPAYTGSDESCASVARHMVTLARPSDATLAKLPPEQRAGVREGIERMLTTLPETVESSCETTPWSLEQRRCILAATTQNTAFACTAR